MNTGNQRFIPVFTIVTIRNEDENSKNVVDV